MLTAVGATELELLLDELAGDDEGCADDDGLAELELTGAALCSLELPLGREDSAGPTFELAEV